MKNVKNLTTIKSSMSDVLCLFNLQWIEITNCSKPNVQHK